MINDPNGIVIVMADDDQEDCMLTREALQESRMINELITVHDGEELMEYLQQTGRYAPPAYAPRPGLILLDLNMPRMDGREALARIKSDENLRRIPIVVLTTSKAEEDVFRSYDMGANSYITKPVTFDSMVDLTKALARYWFSIVVLPDDTD